MLFNVCLVDCANSTLLLSYYFDDATLETQDAWEAAVSSETESLWQTPAGVDVCASVLSRPVVLRAVKDVLFILSGGPSFDELACEAALRSGCFLSGRGEGLRTLPQMRITTQLSALAAAVLVQ